MATDRSRGAFRLALDEWPKNMSHDRAGVQGNLGLVLLKLGEREPGEAGTRLFEEALTAQQEAVREFTSVHSSLANWWTRMKRGYISGERLGRDWAMAQNTSAMCC
jgi:hypothetical protein